MMDSYTLLFIVNEEFSSKFPLNGFLLILIFVITMYVLRSRCLIVSRFAFRVSSSQSIVGYLYYLVSEHRAFDGRNYAVYRRHDP